MLVNTASIVAFVIDTAQLDAGWAKRGRAPLEGLNLSGE